MTFEHQLDALIYFHLEEHSSGRHLVQVLKEDDFARDNIAPKEGIEKSSFFEAINTRGLQQLLEAFEALYAQARTVLPKEHKVLGDLTVIDGSLIDATLSMYWADYRDGAKKAKVHVGFDLNHSIPSKIFLTDGKGDERPFVSQILSRGQTGIMDRYYQCHKNFDQWQQDGKHFVCRIRANTKKRLIRANEVKPGCVFRAIPDTYSGAFRTPQDQQNKRRWIIKNSAINLLKKNRRDIWLEGDYPCEKSERF